MTNIFSTIELLNGLLEEYHQGLFLFLFLFFTNITKVFWIVLYRLPSLPALLVAWDCHGCLSLSLKGMCLCPLFGPCPPRVFTLFFVCTPCDTGCRESQLFFSFFFRFFYRSSSALHRRSSTQILLDHGATFCRGSLSVLFSFLVTAGFEPTSCTLPCERRTTAPLWPPFLMGVHWLHEGPSKAPIIFVFPFSILFDCSLTRPRSPPRSFSPQTWSTTSTWMGLGSNTR